MAETYILRCKNCGAWLDPDDDGDNVVVCPYCGSRELIVESDAVKIARIKSEAYRDVELEKQKFQAEQIRSRENRRFFRRSVFFISLFLILIAALGLLVGLADGGPGSAAVAAVQLFLLTLVMLSGSGAIKKDIFRRLTVLFVITAAVLIPAYCLALVEDGSSEKSEALSWDSYILSEVLPDPEGESGRVYTDSSRALSLYVNSYSKKQFRSYVSACKEGGFTVDQDSASDNSYAAYNDGGYHVDLYYYESSEELSIYLAAPVAMREITWPSHGLARLLPAPSSGIGNIESDSSDYFYAYIGETEEKDFENYVDSCIAAGFDLNYYRYDDQFRAENEDGVRLSVAYVGYQTMTVSLSRYED